QSTVLTDPTGYYLFDHNISAQGTYDVTAYKPPEHPMETQYDIHLFPNETLWVNITFGGGGPGGGNGTLCGFVTYQDTGSPNMGVSVCIDRVDGPPYQACVKTNDSGFYMFNQNISEGNYDITYDKQAEFETIHLYDVQIWANQTHWENVSVTVGGGPGPGPLENITIFGKVYQDFTPNIPIQNANITIYTEGAPFDILGMTTTNSEGYYEITFLPNETAVQNMNDRVEILFEAEGFESNSWSEDIWWMMYDMDGEVDYHDVHLMKIWVLNATITGTVRNIDSGAPIEHVFVMVEGAHFFHNDTETDVNGDFILGAIAGDLELIIFYPGFFTNGTEDLVITEGINDVGTLFLEPKPANTGRIAGNLTSGGQPISDTELILYDPIHPYEGNEKEFPRTDDNGYFEINTYPGSFYLITLAKLIGKSREGPPLAIGGYENVVEQITVGTNQTIYRDISLNSTNPDPITIDIEFTSWNVSTVDMIRQIISNNEIIRMISDINFDGTIDADEAADMEDIVNSSITESEGFDMEALFLSIPLQFRVDNILFLPIETQVEIQNLIGSTMSTTPLNVIVNATYVSRESLIIEEPLGPSLHSVEIRGYLANPAFTSTITTTFPPSYLLKNAKEELVYISGYGTNQATLIPYQDPNWNDSEMYQNIPMLVGTSEPFATFNNSYYVETPFDQDADGDYDYLMGKIRFATTQAADYFIRGTLRSQTGIRISTFETDKYASIESILVEAAFQGEKIYRKHFNGPYSVIFDLYVYDNDSLIWLDSITKTSAAYNISEFDKPPLYFLQILDDVGVDTDNDGLYDFLTIVLQLDVGQIDSYEFDADIGTCDFSYGGDPHIAHMHKIISLYQTGIQTLNFTFDGSLIYEKGTNDSLWVYIQARSFTEGHLDNIDYITKNYMYDEFTSPPPESCTIQGVVTNAFGAPLEAQVHLFNQQTFSENSTTSDSESGNYSIACRPGLYQLEIWCSEPGSNYDNHWEIIVIGESDVNQTITRNISLLPFWHECGWLDWMLDNWQFAPGDALHMNLTSNELPNSNLIVEVYKEIRDNDFYYGQQYLETYSSTTNDSGHAYIVINTSSFTNGQYMLRMFVANESQSFPQVARADAWGLQVSSLLLNFDLDKQKYKPGGTATGAYSLRYISNLSEVVGSTYEWKIMYWDWNGEHILDSDIFINDISGNGSFSFTIPTTIMTYGNWFDLRFTATDPNENEVFAWRGFGITTGCTIESIDDYPVGQPGIYDGLMINITVNVTQADQYRINGGLNGQFWHFITGNETHQYLNIGENIVQIMFEGEDIQREGVNGPYRIWIGLYKEGQWGELDNMEYITSTSYNANEFARPDVGFNISLPLSYYTIGPVDNYNMLVVNASIIASIPGNYSVHGNLHKRVLQPGGWEEWFFVAWNRSETIYIDGVDLNTTIYIPIYFEGTEIYNNEQLGPYNVNFNLHRVQDGNWEEWLAGYDPDGTIPYDYDQFAKPAAHVVTILDMGPDVDENLLITVQINVSDGHEGDYHLNGNLHSSHETGHMWITHTWNETFLHNGSNTMNLVFSGDSIYSMGYNGPYILHLDLQSVTPWNWLGHREFTTSDHNYTDFSIPDALFTGDHSDEGFDDDSDGDYDGIRITVPISFNDTGWFEVSGELYQDGNPGWYWIAWSSNHFEVESSGVQNISLEYSGYDIQNSGREGQYGVHLWLRKDGFDIGHIEFDTDNSYFLDQFGQPPVQFTPDSPYGDELIDGGRKINVSLAINASELGSYYINGHMHKVIPRQGWNEWIWISYAEESITITQTGITMVNVSFDTAQIQTSGYNGPFTVDFNLMDDSWMSIDHIHEYQTQPYMLENLADRPAFFTGSNNDYLSSPTTPEYLIVDLSLSVNESGYYNIGGDLHKNEGWNWNFIAGSGKDKFFTVGNHTVTLQFDTIEIKDNIENLGLTEFDSGSPFDVDVWLRRQNEWYELDHQSFETTNLYYISNFSSTSASIESVSDNGYNISGDVKYEYLNISVTINITEPGEYELWCDLHKQADNQWQWLGWQNKFITVTDPTVENIILQFNGEQISSSEHNGPYQFYMELMNFETRKRMDRYDGETNAYAYSEFISSTVGFNSTSASAEGYDSDDPGSEYDFLRVCVNVTAESETNVEFRGDLHKESPQTGWQWIGWANNWTSIPAGITTMTLDFDGEAIRNSEIDGPYQLRLELWDTDNWKLLDVINNLNTDSHTYDNFQSASAQFNVDSITDWGIPTPGPHAYLEINVSVNVSSAGFYEITGDLHSDTNGWYWLGWANNHTYLDIGDQIVKIQFDGMRIRNQEVNGPYKVRLELRNDNWRTIDRVEPYETNSYNYNEFQSSGAEFISVSDQIISNGDYLELNVTINCTSGGSYWLGADLHKQSGWEWYWIAWESTEETLTMGVNNFTILFSGENIHNREIDGPYHIRLELRDTLTWSEQDFIDQYITGAYAYTDFSQPSVSFAKNQNDEYLITDWGNDTDSDSLYNYLQFNISVNSSQSSTYWLHSDLHKQTGYQW
ncbi:MAG: carboxypeptidase-like regulatory domain-containing protein, partial [Candidatus Thermoplasmatota archaeon]|nr:carboxypeptidase-like regulatory domain-containing protein [Candidatus Thermoplasmatota archaeon]